MALVKCPECNGEISDTAVACPHCGYALIDERTVILEIKTTELKEKQRNIPMGIAFLMFGIPAVLFGLFLIVMIVGVFAIVGGVALISVGISNMKWSQIGQCPYCGLEIKVQCDATNFKCQHCKKTGVKKGEFLEAVTG